MSKKVERSFSSAGSSLPVKLILNAESLEMIKSGNLQPVSVNINPTNKCNLKCPFCSCSNRDKKLELDIDAIEIFFLNHPTIQSTIITGGGEPLLYRDFGRLVNFLFDNSVSIGMASNGLLLRSQPFDVLEKITWIRVSLSVDSLDNDLYRVLNDVIPNVDIDWSFSYVCSGNTAKDYECIIKFYGQFFDKINHMRVVNDLCTLDDRVDRIKAVCEETQIDLSKMIFQTRVDHTPGAKKCYIAIMKPNIAADGKIMPCCGVQYAIKDREIRDYIGEFSMGDINDSEKVFGEECFDGSKCNVCYYSGYNNMIASLIGGDIEHLEFI